LKSNAGESDADRFEAAIAKQVELLLRVRAVFPAMSHSVVGESAASAGPFYQNLGYSTEFEFGSPLTDADVDSANAIAHWINQNFIVRLCATLEAYNVISNEVGIDKCMRGANAVDILRRLRNVFAHSQGIYRPSNKKHKKLRTRVISYLGGASRTSWKVPHTDS
jgi:hypothetical protein